MLKGRSPRAIWRPAGVKIQPCELVDDWANAASDALAPIKIKLTAARAVISYQPDIPSIILRNAAAAKACVETLTVGDPTARRHMEGAVVQELGDRLLRRPGEPALHVVTRCDHSGMYARGDQMPVSTSIIT